MQPSPSTFPVKRPPGRLPMTWVAGCFAEAMRGLGLPHLLLLGFVLRLLAMAVPSAVHPDEIFQYLETAHRLLFGQGVITWEWRDGIRGWMLPWLTAGPMWLGERISPGGSLYVLLPSLAMAGLSLVTVVVAWRLGARISRLHAVFAAFVAAIWYEFVYFAPHVLSETASIALILPAALLLTGRDRWSNKRLALAGALLADAAALRFQHLPGIAVLALASCRHDVRRSWRPLLLGGLAGLLPSGLCDLTMGATPYAWMLRNYHFNITEHRAAGYGTSGVFGYLAELWPRWALWSVPLLLLACLGARRYPALAWMAGANLLFHCLVAHKEYRFILLSTVPTVLLAAIGTIDWVREVARRDGAEAGRSKLRFLTLAWLAASISLAAGGFRGQWSKFEPELSLYGQLRADPAFCGVAVYRHDWSVTGGYAYLHRDVPMLYFSDEDNGSPGANLASHAGTVNAILTTPDHGPEMPAAFVQADCRGRDEARICIYRRPGGCGEPAPRFTMNAVLQRLGH